MKKKLLKSILRVTLVTVLSVSSMILSTPLSVYADAEPEPQLPSVTKFALPEDLKDANNFALRKNGSAVAQKVNFGNEIVWYIAGKDTDDSLVLICEPKKQYFGTHAFLEKTKYKYYDLNTYINVSKFENKDVYANHYGASDIRNYLLGEAIKKFSSAEQALMINTTVGNRDIKNRDSYSTLDKLYLADGFREESEVISVGSGIGIALKSDSATDGSPYAKGNYNDFWLRTPYEYVSDVVLYASLGNRVNSSNAYRDELAVVPAFNMDLSSVLFASAAPAASIVEEFGNAFTFRIDAGDKIGSTAKYNPYVVCVTKGTDSGELFLYAQGKDDNGDWVNSFAVPDEGGIWTAKDIHEGADLSDCKVWLETTNGDDNLAYAKMVSDEETTAYNITLNVNDNACGSVYASVEESDVSSALMGAPIELTAIAKDGYDFVKWESEDVAVNEEDTFIMPAKDVTLTAVFELHDFGTDGKADECSICHVKNFNAASLDDVVVVEDLDYTGLEQTPIVTINGLTENTDYEVLFDGPKTDVGEYDVTITGIGAYFGTRNVKWKIDTGTPVCNTPTGLRAIFGQKLRDVSLESINSDGNTEGTWSWNNELQSVGNAGENTFKATFTPTDTQNIKVMHDLDIAVMVEKAKYSDNIPFIESYFWNKQYDEKQIDLTQFVPKDAGETSYEITSQTPFPEGATDTISSAKIENGILKFAVSKMDDYVLNAATTLEIKVTMQNYTDFSKTIRITRTAEGLWCANIPDQVFTGKAIKPVIEVYSDGGLLTAGKDYTVSYKNNTKVADKAEVNAKGASIAPSVIITGKGNYSGKVTLTFSIVKRNLAGSEIAKVDGYNGADYEASDVADILVASTGKDIKVSTTVTVEGKKLKAGTDYFIAKDADGNDPVDKIFKSDVDYVGTHSLYVVGKGNYSGSVAFYYVVTEDKLA